MEYFTGELWKEINSDDKTIRAQAELKWGKNDALYTKKYNKEKERFPDTYIQLYESMSGFHDFKIHRITMETGNWSTRNCTIELSDGEAIFELVFQKISSFVVNCPSLCNCWCNELRWGYDEIGHKGRQLTLSVLCDYVTELSIVFKTVTVHNKADSSP